MLARGRELGARGLAGRAVDRETPSAAKGGASQSLSAWAVGEAFRRML